MADRVFFLIFLFSLFLSSTEPSRVVVMQLEAPVFAAEVRRGGHMVVHKHPHP
jgi:hypothetical protein